MAKTNRPRPEELHAALGPALLRVLLERQAKGTLTARQRGVLAALEAHNGSQGRPPSETILANAVALLERDAAGQLTEVERGRARQMRYVLSHADARRESLEHGGDGYVWTRGVDVSGRPVWTDRRGERLDVREF